MSRQGKKEEREGERRGDRGERRGERRMRERVGGKRREGDGEQGGRRTVIDKEMETHWMHTLLRSTTLLGFRCRVRPY